MFAPHQSPRVSEEVLFLVHPPLNVKKIVLHHPSSVKKYKLSGQLRYVVKYKAIKMAKSLLKQYCYCPMLLMKITKTAVCL